MPVETPPCRVKKAWTILGCSSAGAWIMLEPGSSWSASPVRRYVSLRQWQGVAETGELRHAWTGKSDRLEQRAHSRRPPPRQPSQRGVDGRRLRRIRSALQPLRTSLDAQRLKECAL